MNVAKPVGSAAINQSSEMDVEGGIHELLTRASDALRQAENSDEEMLASVDTWLGRVSESSTREIENLIDKLQTLHINCRLIVVVFDATLWNTQA